VEVSAKTTAKGLHEALASNCCGEPHFEVRAPSLAHLGSGHWLLGAADVLGQRIVNGGAGD